MNPAEDYIQAHETASPFNEYIADHGQAISSRSERELIAGHPTRLSDDVTQADRSLIRAAIQATQPRVTECFNNALKMWEYNPRFKYAEGVAVPSDIANEAVEHAWCMLDGTKLIDFTPEFTHHYGVVITSESVLEQYAGSETRQNGIIGDHSNQHDFLRERGYIPRHD